MQIRLVSDYCISDGADPLRLRAISACRALVSLQIHFCVSLELLHFKQIIASGKVEGTAFCNKLYSRKRSW